jgi:hypothetical protein
MGLECLSDLGLPKVGQEASELIALPLNCAVNLVHRHLATAFHGPDQVLHYWNHIAHIPLR